MFFPSFRTLVILGPFGTRGDGFSLAWMPQYMIDYTSLSLFTTRSLIGEIALPTPITVRNDAYIPDTHQPTGLSLRDKIHHHSFIHQSSLVKFVGFSHITIFALVLPPLPPYRPYLWQSSSANISSREHICRYNNRSTNMHIAMQKPLLLKCCQGTRISRTCIRNEQAKQGTTILYQDN